MPLIKMSELSKMLRNFKIEACRSLRDVQIAIVKKSIEGVNGKDQDFWRRILIQNLYAMVETEIVILKLTAIENSKKGRRRLSADEIAFLNGYNYKLKDNGEVQRQEIFSSLIPELKFALKIYSKSSGLSFAPEFKSKKWSKFKTFIEIRNRVVHPKRMKDLKISTQDTEDSIDAWEWFVECIVSQKEELAYKLKKRTGKKV